MPEARISDTRKATGIDGAMRAPLRALVFFVLSGMSLAVAQPLRVVIRVDDVQSRSTTLPRSIKPFEHAVMSRGGKVTWLAIPHRLVESQNVDGVLNRELQASVASGNEVGQHGHNHICVLCGSSGHEMLCTIRPFSSPEQLGFVNSGRQLLLDSMDFVPRLFVSPGHNEDTTTYAVLSAAGFDAISTTRVPTGPVTPALFNLPPGPDYTWQLTSSAYASKLAQALADIGAAASSSGSFVVLYHDPFIRPGYLSGLVVQWTEALLDSLAAQYGQRLKILTLSQAIGQLRDGAPARLASLKAEVNNQGAVTVSWQTSAELNIWGYQVQKKLITSAWWTTIANSFVPGHGTTSESHDYGFVDPTSAGGSWEYRVAQVDSGGMLHYSEAIQPKVVTKAGETGPITFGLDQNYPNPFNPETVIRYHVPGSGRVDLGVFDLLGREVATLVNEVKAPGTYAVRFNAGGLPSGIYICRLTMEGSAGPAFVQSKKLLLLK